jgi:hypothetical protein
MHQGHILKLFNIVLELTIYSSITNTYLCKEIMSRVQEKVKEAMMQPDATSQTIIENTALLIQLKEDPIPLTKQYIQL